MNDIREVSGSTSGVALYDNWITLEEVNHMIWAFEYDGSAVLWGNVKQGDKHFPRKLTMWLDDLSAKSTSYLFHIGDRINEEVKPLTNSPHLFSTDMYIDAVIDCALSSQPSSWWETHNSILFLNDNYEGGEIVFNDLGIEVTPRMGSLLVYPGSYSIETRPIHGTAYRMLSKHTDQPEFRQSDESFTKRPFMFQNEKPQKKKKKGCKK